MVGLASVAPLAGKFMPLLARAGSAKALPWLIRGGMVTGGAAPGLMRGDLGQAVYGGSLGALGSLGVTGPMKGLATGSGGLAANIIGRSGWGAQQGVNLAGNLAKQQLGSSIAAGGVGLAGGLASGRLSAGVGGAVQGGAGNVLGAGATQATRDGNLVPMSSLPANYQPDSNNMVRGPEGNWWYYYNPGGVPAGNRLNRQLDAVTSASNLNTIGNALYGQTERVARSEFERQAAAEQLKANIAQAKEMAIASQAAGLKIGTDAGVGMANAMSNRSQFRYL